MAITIKPALRKNPQDKDAAAKYYAQVVLAPEMTLEQIVEQIADRCTPFCFRQRHRGCQQVWSKQCEESTCYLRSLDTNQKGRS